MKLEEFIKSSAFLEIQISKTFFSPAIPREKLLNAIRAYAHHIKPQQALILIDEGGFFSEGEEGMIITNDEIILSRNYGSTTISFDDIQSIDIKNKALIINNNVVAVFNKPEIRPLAYLGSKLSEYIESRQHSKQEDFESNTAIQGEKLDKLKVLLANLSKAIPFKVVPKHMQMLQPKSKNYVLDEELTEEQVNFIKFKFHFALNEKILSVVWLDLHDSKDEFFCITNDAIYSTKDNIRISFEELKDLDVCYIYKKSIYTFIEFSNEKAICVSRINGITRPFAYELLSELVKFLNTD